MAARSGADHLGRAAVGIELDLRGAALVRDKALERTDHVASAAAKQLLAAQHCDDALGTVVGLLDLDTELRDVATVRHAAHRVAVVVHAVPRVERTCAALTGRRLR